MPFPLPSSMLDRLSHSSFRARFTLKAKELSYFQQQGMEKIISHGKDFINQRLAPAEPKNDGKQTPWKGHPVFIAQHATATCCRGCLEKWYHIPKKQPLTEEEQTYILSVIQAWLTQDLQKH